MPRRERGDTAQVSGQDIGGFAGGGSRHGCSRLRGEDEYPVSLGWRFVQDGRDPRTSVSYETLPIN